MDNEGVASLVGNTRFVGYVLLAELVAHRFVYCIVSGSQFVGTVALPRIRPTPVEATHGVPVRAGNQDFRAFLERQDAVVLQQHLRFLGSLEGSLGEVFAAELRVVFRVSVGGIEEAEAVFQAEDTGDGVVDTAHRHFAFVYQLFQVVAEADFIRYH